MISQMPGKKCDKSTRKYREAFSHICAYLKLQQRKLFLGYFTMLLLPKKRPVFSSTVI